MTCQKGQSVGSRTHVRARAALSRMEELMCGVFAAPTPTATATQGPFLMSTFLQKPQPSKRSPGQMHQNTQRRMNQTLSGYFTERLTLLSRQLEAYRKLSPEKRLVDGKIPS